MDINLKRTVLMSRAVVPHMVQRHSGVIINNSSGWGIVGGDAAVAYCASKGGGVLLTKAKAVDNGREGHPVNFNLPAGVGTPTLPENLPNGRRTWGGYPRGVCD